MTRTKDVCAATGADLTPGELHVAALLEHPEESALTRVLYALDAWEAGPELPEGATLFGFWRRRVPEEGERDTHALVSDDEVMDLFEQMEGATDESQVVFRYLIALMLMRKRRLILERADRDGDVSTLVVRQRVKGGDGPVFEVVDPQMDDEAITQGIEALGRVVSMDLDA